LKFRWGVVWIRTRASQGSSRIHSPQANLAWWFDFDRIQIDGAMQPMRRMKCGHLPSDDAENAQDFL
jgi:hypothetical protein